MAKRDNRPSVIDLFSGVGGLSLGAARAGFRVAASAELDPIASKSHADNFPNTKHIERDVGKLPFGRPVIAAVDGEGNGGRGRGVGHERGSRRGAAGAQ